MYSGWPHRRPAPALPPAPMRAPLALASTPSPVLRAMGAPCCWGRRSTGGSPPLLAPSHGPAMPLPAATSRARTGPEAVMGPRQADGQPCTASGPAGDPERSEKPITSTQHQQTEAGHAHQPEAGHSLQPEAIASPAPAHSPAPTTAPPSPPRTCTSSTAPRPSFLRSFAFPFSR